MRDAVDSVLTWFKRVLLTAYGKPAGKVTLLGYAELRRISTEGMIAGYMANTVSLVISSAFTIGFSFWLLFYGQKLVRQYKRRKVETLQKLLEDTEHSMVRQIVLISLSFTLLAKTLKTVFVGALLALFIYHNRKSIPYSDELTYYILFFVCLSCSAFWWYLDREFSRLFPNKEALRKKIEDLKTG